MTVQQFYSDIVSMLRSDNIDDWISPRLVHSEAKSIIADFIRKSNDANKRLYRLTEGWSEIPCLHLEEVPVSECSGLEVRLCQKLMKSKIKLPDTYTSSQGDIIKFVSNQNLDKYINFTTPRTWSNIQKREYRDKSQYYYFFVDGYFYIPIPKDSVIAIEEIRLEAYFKDKYEVDLFNNIDQNCPSCHKNAEICTSPLDYQLVLPFYLENQVKQELYNRLLKLFKSIPEDAYPDMSPEKSGQQDRVNQKNGLNP